MATLITRIVLRNDSTANWLANENVVLLKGEIGLEFPENGKVKMKVGDGVKTWAELDYFGGESLKGDDLSVLVENGIIKLKGFDTAAVGSQLVKGSDGSLSWVLPDTTTVEGLNTAVGTLQTEVATVQEDVKNLNETVTDLESKMSTVYQFKGTVDNFSDLPTENLEVGHVYNIVNASDGIEAGDNVAWTGSEWDVLGGSVDLSGYVTAETFAPIEAAVNAIPEFYDSKKYEICYVPNGTLVDYNDKEIRVMCPAKTAWAVQNVGAGGDSSKYYIGIKAYAPNNDVTGFKEDLAETITDETLYSFEGNDFAGIDEFGRKYSIVWLPVAAFDSGSGTGEWTYYGAGSTAKKYVGWYYSVEWYNANGEVVASDCIRINLSNEDCHNVVAPYYMGDVVKGVSVNGTLLDVVNNQVNIALGNAETAGVVKSSTGANKVTIESDGTMTVSSVNMNTLVQSEGDVLILNGGSSSI